MQISPELVNHFKQSVQELFERPSHRCEDSRFDRIRGRAAAVLEQYADDPLDTSLIQKCHEVIEELESLSQKNMTNDLWQRSQTNVVVVSALSRRTHYAAYVAGKWSADRQIGNVFKAWMHNAAADGAISLYEAIAALAELDDDLAGARAVLRIFGDGALSDAHRFLSQADLFYPNCVVTKYNRGKLEILDGSPHAVERGTRLLLEIEPPGQDCHPAEISWHIDNLDSFQRRDAEVRRILEVEQGDALRSIGDLLERNAQVAVRIKDARGEGLWKGQNHRSRAVLTAISTGMIVTLYGVISMGSTASASGVVRDLVSSHQAIAQQVSEAEPGAPNALARGAGGLRADDAFRGAGGMRAEALARGAEGLGPHAAEGQEVWRCVFGRENILA